MIKKRILLALFTVIITFSGFNAYAQEARARYELMNLIRKEKFDLILPQAMRDNNIDMWIHVIKRGDPDPLELDLGGDMGYFVFSDRGGDRIERAIFGADFWIADRSVYDIIDPESNLKKYVTECNPKCIAVNMSDWINVADGLSYTGYKKLVKLIGKKYEKRLVSSENVITDFRVRRVQTEIIAFAHACEIQRQIMERGLKRIKPGITTRKEIGWWAEDQFMSRGLSAVFSGFGPEMMPGVLHSEVSSPEETRKPDYIYQKGDLIGWDIGIKYLNFGTDIKRYVYILRDGETSLPVEIQHVWDLVLKAREVISKTIKVGFTADEALKAIAAAIEKAGYIYTPYTDIWEKDRKLINSLGKSEKPGFSIDCHCVGNSGDSEIAVGPSIAPFRQGRAHLKIQQNNLFAFEFMVHTWMPKWGRRFSFNLEDDAIVTEKGVEFLYPPNQKIILIH